MMTTRVFSELMPWLYAMNILAFVYYAWDRHCQACGMRRLWPAVQWFFTAAFGAFGMLCGMVIFGHGDAGRKNTLAVVSLLGIQLIVTLVLLLR